MFLTVFNDRIHEIEKGIGIVQPSFDLGDVTRPILHRQDLGYRFAPAGNNKTFMLKNDAPEEVAEFAFKFGRCDLIAHGQSIH